MRTMDSTGRGGRCRPSKRGVRMGVVCLLALGATARGADWPCYRGLNKDGRSSERIGAWPPKEVWRASVGQGFSSTVVSDGRVYTMGWSGGRDTVYCFREGSAGANPAPLWTQSYACSSVSYPGTRATPTVDGNEVYTFSQEGWLCCFDKADGTLLWGKAIGAGRPGWGFASSPLIEGNLVIVNAGGHGTAIDKTHPGSHAVVWGGDNNAAGYASPFAFTRGNQRTVVVFGGRNASGVDPATGSVLWWLDWGGEGMADPIVYGDQVWVSRGYGQGCAVASLGSGALSKVWSNKALANKENCSVLYNGYVYGVSEGGGLRCVSFATGATLWNQPGFGTESALMLAGDRLVVMNGSDGGDNGDLVVVQASPAGYSEVYRTNNILAGDTWITPTLSNGRLYLRSQAGNFLCLDVLDPAQRALYVLSPRGGASPGTVVTNYGARLLCQVTNSPQVLGGTTQYACKGWTLTGNADTNGLFAGNGTRASLILTNSASLTWQWQTEFRLNPGTNGHGRVNLETGWFAQGTSVVLTATAEPSWGFTSWSGDTNGCSGSGTSLRIPMDRARTIVANFVQTGTVQFGSPAHRVAEAAGSVTIPVTREGGSYGAVSVRYATANGSAAAGTDYTARSGSLAWANGDQAPKSIVIPILNDSRWEADETFTVGLSGLSGGSPGSPTQTVVTIGNDDAPALARVEVAGPVAVAEGSTQSYSARGIWEDGASEDLAGRAVWAENSVYASVTPDGRLSVSNTVLADALCTLSASYGGKTGSANVLIQNSLRPDFRIAGLSVSPRQSLVAGKPFTTYVAVRNDGDVAGNAGYLDVWLNQPAEVTNKLHGNRYATAGSLAAGQSTTVVLTGLTAPASNGTFTLRAAVDSQWLTTEKSETNNQATYTYTVRALTNLLIVAGPARIGEATGAQYRCQAQFQDGTAEDVTADAAWSVSSLSASISAGYLTTGSNVAADVTFQVKALFGGRTAVTNVLLINDLRPDFRITRIQLTPGGTVPCGKPFAASVTVVNSGATSGEGGSLDVWLNQPAEVAGKLHGNKYVNVGPLGSGQSRTLTLTGLAAPAARGDYTLRAYVDSQGMTAEEDEADNQATLSYTCKVLTNVVLSAGPGVVGEGETNRYTLTALWDDASREDVSAGAVWTAQSAYVLSAGGGWLVTASTLAAESSVFTLSASFGGRSVSRSVTVMNTMRPDFLIAALSMSPVGPLIAGSSFAAYVTVRNDGAAAGNAGYLDVWANRPADVTNKLHGTKYVAVGLLGAGEARTMAMPGLTAPGAAGTYTLRACADSQWLTAEQAETNNQATLDYTVRSVASP